MREGAAARRHERTDPRVQGASTSQPCVGVWLSRRAFVPLCLCAFVFVSACSSSKPAARAAQSGGSQSAAQPGTQPIPLPDLSKLEPTVQAQLRAQQDVVTRTLDNRAASVVDRSRAFGDMGRLLMAAQLPEAAQANFTSAQALDPSDYRWPYYLAQLARSQGDLPRAASLFDRVLQLKPDDIDTLVWLGDTDLSAGRADAAEPLFARALQLDSKSVSARFGLGRTALARNDNRKAVEYLEEVLRLNPKATAAHYPLSLAYAALGDTAKSAEHLRQRRDGKIAPADTLMVELDSLLNSPQTHETLGIRALDREDWQEAASQFKQGLALAPDSPALHHRLATALSMMGDKAAARAEFETAVARSPEYFPAQFSLGVLLQSEGHHAEAVERFAAALSARPTYTEARLRMASSLRRLGRAREALDAYQQVLNGAADNAEARIGYAMTLSSLHRDRDALNTLQEAARAPGDQSLFTHGEARLLAASPDPKVRDGRRAMELVQQLLQRGRTIELGETYAMALAETGEFPRAAAIQRDIIAATERSGQTTSVKRLTARLALYERAEPCRTPWTDEEGP
jgi:tetratricopeptide (TPR) repeat protein